VFFIVNKTKKTIALGDLGITLGPRQAIDLDKIMKRSKSDGSQALKIARKKGDIEIRVKDKPISKVSPIAHAQPPSVDLSSMKKEIIGEMKDTMKELLKGQGGVSKEDLQNITQTLLNAMPKNTETVIYRQDQENIVQRKDEDVEIDSETLAKINARTVDNIVKNTTVESVHYEEKQAENTILDNVDELEGLLG
jgi:hypothetical protein